MKIYVLNILAILIMAFGFWTLASVFAQTSQLKPIQKYIGYAVGIVFVAIGILILL